MVNIFLYYKRGSGIVDKVKVLMVCGGNMQRSQAVAHYLDLFARENGFPLEVKSAGVRIELIKRLQKIGEGADTFPLSDRIIERLDRERYEDRVRELKAKMKEAMEQPPSAKKKREMERLRLLLSKVRRTKGTQMTTRHAKPVTRELFEWADVVIAADASVREKLMKMFPNNSRKVQLAREMAAGRRLPKRAGDFADAYPHGKVERYRRGTKKGDARAYWLVVTEARGIARRIIERKVRKPARHKPTARRTLRKPLGKPVRRRRV
jgi:protein-tyrosine-phosphatase